MSQGSDPNVLQLKGRVKVECFDLEDKLLWEEESENFLTSTFTRMLYEQGGLSSFMRDFPSADKPITAGYSAYCNTALATDKSIKWALVCTDNTTPIAAIDESKLKELPGTMICMTQGKKATYVDTDTTIIETSLIPSGGIKIVAKIGTTVVGNIGTIGLVMPLDFNFNTDLSNKVYPGAVGELLYNDSLSFNYSVSSAVKYNGKIYMVANYTPPAGSVSVWLIDITNGSPVPVKQLFIGKSYNTYQGIFLQVIGTELWVMAAYSTSGFMATTNNTYNFEVYDTTLTYLRGDNMWNATPCYQDSQQAGFWFINGGYLYGVTDLNEVAKTFNITKAKLVSSGVTEANVVVSVAYSGVNDGPLVLLGSYNGVGTEIMTAKGHKIDIATLMVTPTLAAIATYPKVATPVPAGIIHPSVVDGFVYGLVHRNHKINIWTDISTVQGPPIHLINSVFYPNVNSYFIKVMGGSALTCDLLSAVKAKTTTNKLTITYTIS